MFWEKKNETKILYLALLFVQLHLHMLNIGFLCNFSFPKTLFPSFLHHLYFQFLYPTHFLVIECFSLLVSYQVCGVDCEAAKKDHKMIQDMG